jgi:hypothetical protein
VPDPRRPETHEVLLARARALHPGEVIPDDAPSRFKREGAAAPAPAPAATAPPTAPAAPAAPPAPAPQPPTAVEPLTLAIPPPEEWEVPITCYRCGGEYAVPVPTYRAGVVFRCPHCQSALVPTLSMVRAVREALEDFHARWTAAFEEFRARRQRELEQFEDRQRRALAEFEARLRRIAGRERAPGTPVPRRSPFAF